MKLHRNESRGFHAIVAIVMATIFVACQPNQQPQPGQPGAPKAPHSPTSPNPPVAQGTSDGTGGNGFHGKVFESYIVTVPNHQAYKEHIAPLFGEGLFLQMFKMKTWFVAPVKINQISKEVLGVTFAKDETDQIGGQTEDEVWLDKNYTDKMSSVELADLFLHEGFLNLYLLKFEPPQSLCKMLVKSGMKADECAAYMKLIGPSEPRRKLTRSDYSSIRSAVEWAKQGRGRITDDESRAFLGNLGFDNRIFNAAPPSFSDRVSLPRYKADDLQRLVQIVPTLNGAEFFCRFGESEAVHCRVVLSVTESTTMGSKLNITVTAQGLSRQFTSWVSKKELSMGSSTSGSTMLFRLSLEDIDSVGKKLGETVSEIMLFFRPTSVYDREDLDLWQRMRFAGISINQGIVVNSQIIHHGMQLDNAFGSGTQSECVKSAKIESNDPFKGTISIAHSEELTTKVKFWADFGGDFLGPICKTF